MDYNLLKIFNTVAEIGSLSGASKVLKIPKSKISRDLTHLENFFGETLFLRGPRGSRLTTEGSLLFQETKAFVSKGEAISQIFSVGQDKLRGKIRVSVPEDMSQVFFHHFVDDFQRRNPSVEIEIISTNDALSFDEYNLDISVRVGKLKDSSLLQKKILTINLLLVASEKYIRKFGHPTRLIDFHDHRFYTFTDFQGNELLENIMWKSVIKSNSFMGLFELVKGGHGIALLPDFVVKQSKLKSILKDEIKISKEAFLISRPIKYLPQRIVEFKKELEERMKHL